MTADVAITGRDTCNGDCEGAGCTCAGREKALTQQRHPACRNGCTRPHCRQGRRTCWGEEFSQQDKPAGNGAHVPMRRPVRLLVKHPADAKPLVTILMLTAVAGVAALVQILSH